MNPFVHKLIVITFSVLGTCVVLCQGGCSALGYAASAIPQSTKAAYNGLQEQSVGVMVWADNATLLDFGSIQLDLANSIQSKLQSSKASEISKATFPVKPASIVRFQRDNPGSESQPITEVAPKLGVSRLIYVEIASFQTRSSTSIELYRGSTTAALKVIEVNQRVAKIGYNEVNVQASFPKKIPIDGIPNADESKIYIGTVDALSTEIVNRLLTHETER